MEKLRWTIIRCTGVICGTVLFCFDRPWLAALAIAAPLLWPVVIPRFVAWCKEPHKKKILKIRTDKYE